MNEIVKEIQTKARERDELLDGMENYITNNFYLTDDRGRKWTVLEARKYFKIEIPEEVNFLIIVKLAQELSEKYQKATYLRDKQKIKLSIIKNAQAEKYDSAYQTAREETRREMGKPLAAKSCEVAARLATKVLEDSSNTQQVIYDFWDGVCKTLVETRKHIEAISIALSGDAKIQRDFVVKGN